MIFLRLWKETVTEFKLPASYVFLFNQCRTPSQVCFFPSFWVNLLIMNPNWTRYFLATIMNAWVAIVEPILSNSEKIGAQSKSDLPTRLSSLIRYIFSHWEKSKYIHMIVFNIIPVTLSRWVLSTVWLSTSAELAVHF
jgi:hypothetical protein